MTFQSRYPSRYVPAKLRKRRFVGEEGIYNPRAKFFADSIFAGTLNASHIKAGTINASIVNVIELYANNISRGTVPLLVLPEMPESKISDAAITEVKIAQEAISQSKLQRNSIGSEQVRAREIFAHHIAVGTILSEHIAANAIVSSKIAAGTILASHIKAGQITADRFNSTLYGDITQAMRYVKRVLGAGYEFTDAQGSADLRAGSQNIGSIARVLPQGTFTPTLRIGMTRRWDDGSVWWDNVASFKWDIPTQLTGVWISGVQDLGSTEAGELSTLVSRTVDDDSKITITLDAIFSKDNIAWGSNENCDDNTWYSMQRQTVGDTWVSNYVSLVLTYRYFKVRITLTTSDNTKRVMTYNITYNFNIINLFGYQTELVIGTDGVTIALAGFNKKPAVTITAMGTTPKVGLVSGLTAGSANIKVYKTDTKALTRGSVCVTVIGA